MQGEGKMRKNTAAQVRYWIPEGCVTDEGLRADVRSLARRGFGAIELVAVNFFGTPMPDDARWGTPRYYEAVRTVLDEASSLGLAVDIANGPGWPISVPQISDADDPATLYELTYGVAEVKAGLYSSLVLPERRSIRDEGTSELVATCAYRIVGEKVLDESSYRDLQPHVMGDKIDWAPEEGTGTWAIFAFWGQPACHKVLHRFYVVDHLSRAGAEASVAWWEHELLPALGEQADHLRSFFCDSLEYAVAMEWTRDFAKAFEGRHGYSVLPYLPVVGEYGTYPKNDVPGYTFADEALTRAVRHDYLDTCSWLYVHEHLGTLSEGARRLGKTVRYQVSYNKPFCEEDAATAADIPENESLGRPTLDNLRAMAGAVHLTRKPRYSFEAAAEFGHGYGQMQEDMLWWIKRAVIAGCNAQVLHGASYCGDGVEGVDWPGWEAWNRFCSNNWNRTLSERSLSDMLAAIARLNELRRERALVDLAFYREAYLNDGHGGDGDHLVRDGSLLNAHGYTYEFLSPGLLAHANATVRDGRLDPDGSAYKALVIAEQQGMTRTGMERAIVLAKAGLPVFVVGAKQLAPLTLADLADLPAWNNDRDLLLDLSHVVNDYGELLEGLASCGIRPDAAYRDANVLSAHVRRGDEDIYLLYNGNRTGADEQRKVRQDTIMPAILRGEVFHKTKLEVELPGEGSPFLYDLMRGFEYALAGEPTECGVRLCIPMDGDQMVVVGLRKDVGGLPVRSLDGGRTVKLGAWSLRLFQLQPSEDPCDFLAGGFAEVASIGEMPSPCAFDEVDGCPEAFAGYGEYHCVLDLTELPREAVLRLPAWSDALELDVNGKRVPVVAGLGHEVDVRSELKVGENDVTIRVYTNLSNAFDKKANQRYGLFGNAWVVVR